tara:strand:+ start:371 stop:2041 length:1671 start_codon:yes stop_codon:yes gene_type:complete
MKIFLNYGRKIFIDGELRLFSDEGLTIISSWPNISSRSRSGEDTIWKDSFPEINLNNFIKPNRQLSLPFIVQEDFWENNEPVNRFMEKIPGNIRNKVGQFKDKHFEILRLISHSNHAHDLLKCSPALLYALAASHKFRRANCKNFFSKAVQYARKKKKDIAGWLGLSASKRSVKIINKIPINEVEIDLLLRLRKILKSNNKEAMKALSHVPRINKTIIEFVSNPETLHHVSGNLLANVLMPQKNKSDSIYNYFEDVLRMARIVRPNYRNMRFNTLRELKFTHDNLVREINEHKKLKGLLKYKFPDPPLPGTRDIVPLSNPRELISEGLSQKNCIASYASKVSKREVFIYKILFPERATLSLARRSNSWKVGELKAACNRKVRSETSEYVFGWYQKYYKNKIKRESPKPRLSVINSLLPGQSAIKSLFLIPRPHEVWKDQNIYRNSIIQCFFPCQPFPNTEAFEYIGDIKELIRENEALKNDVVIYSGRAAIGAVAIYKILTPQRGTLILEKFQDRFWRIYSIKREGGTEPDFDLESAIKNWIKNSIFKARGESLAA